MHWILIGVLLLSATKPSGEVDKVTEVAIDHGAPQRLVEAFGALEATYEVPEEFRGLLMAKAWRESRFNEAAKGDWYVYDTAKRKLVKCQRGQPGCNAHAVGCLQAWKWLEVREGIDRLDCVATARAYLKVIRERLARTAKVCGTVSAKAAWIVTQMRVNRGPKYRSGPFAGQERCAGSTPKSIQVLKRWKAIAEAPRLVQR